MTSFPLSLNLRQVQYASPRLSRSPHAHQKDAAKGADALTWICWTAFWLHFAVYIYVIIGNMLILIIS